MQTFLVPQDTVVTSKGDSSAVAVSGATHRVLLLTLNITDILEQQSLDVSIFGSADGNTWGQKSLAAFPQKFYRGHHPLLLDLTKQSEVKYLRAHWEVNRWGRGSETPRFTFDIALQEVPPEILRETAERIGAKA